MSTRPLNILFSGMIAADPHQGGATWAILQYLLGLRRLGHHVTFIEPLPQASLRPEGASLGQSDNASYFRKVMGDFAYERDAALLLAGTSETVGLPFNELCERSKAADLLINVSGMMTAPELLNPVPQRVYLDLDPAFVQLWHATQGIDMRLAAHTHFVTVGQSIGSPHCDVPTCGVTWIPTLPPVVLEDWPSVARSLAPTRGYTTIANWRGYGSIHHGGVHYGQKCHALRPIIELPGRTHVSLEPAIAIHPNETADLEALKKNGWRFVDPATVANTPAAYRQFIRESRGEFGIAKSGYVHSRCGWFSDRSACYLASGRPVVAQDTGFGRHLPTGMGLLSFSTMEEARDGLERVEADYGAHASAARRIATEFLDSDRVLTHLLNRLGHDA